jgi:Fe-S-cluster containining protein
VLDGAVPSAFSSGSGVPAPDDGAIEQTGELLDEIIRPLDTRALRAVIDEACGPCGACCLDEGGILCGADEWPMIRDGLAASGAGDLARSPVKGTDLVSVETHRYVVYESPSDREDAQVRRACVAVGFREGRWRCAIERVKPAGCIAYPLKLLLHESPAGHPQRVIGLELEDCSSREPCALEKALRRDRGLLDAYREAVRQRVCHREGTFALAEYNRSRRSLAADRHAGSAP